MAIKIKPKKKRQISLPDSFDILFYYSIVLLFFSISSYLLVTQWNTELRAQISEKEELLEEIEEEAGYQDRQDFIFESQRSIEKFSEVLEERNAAENAFNFLEQMVHPLVLLDTASVDMDNGSISISGFAYSFYVLEQQYSILKDFSITRSFSGWVPAERFSPETEEYYQTYLDGVETGVWRMREMDDLQVFERDLDDGGVREVIFSVTEEGDDLRYERFQRNITVKEEGEDKRIVPEDDILIVFYSPLRRTQKKTVSKENSPLYEEGFPVFYKADQEEYVIESLPSDEGEMLNTDWYEVLITERIKPIEEVILSNVAERDGKFGVAFDFSIEVDPIIFKQ